jgi:hypothetical protein
LQKVIMEADFADRMVEQAVTDCAATRFSGDESRVRLALLRGECSACACVSDALCVPLSAHLRNILPGVKAVYKVRPPSVPTGEPAEPRHEAAIHIALWMESSEPSQLSVAQELETSLAESRRRLGCPNVNEDCFTLDIHFMDNADVRQRRSLAGLLADPSVMTPLWQRGDGDVEDDPHVPSDRPAVELPVPFEPELIPEDKLIDYALRIEGLPAQDRESLEHHLTQLKVTLIRRLISDHLDYIDVAKRWLSVEDLADILRHRIGQGRIGGKSAGMLLAGRILERAEREDIKSHIHVPESFFVGSDLMYIFMAMNGLTHWTDQKYKPEKDIRSDYPLILEQFSAGDFPPEILDAFRSMLDAIGPCPLIVRSSSQLEDSLGTSFAGKYDSHFCPNQGTPEANLRELTRAIALTYASTFKPDPLLYRRSKGLQDYDERMAVLIQQVQGGTWGDAYFPFAAGVAFSRNFYRWAPQIKREEGFMRMVWGLGTRAVERVGNDYPRLVALSHPTLHPDDSPEAIRRYSQQFVDVIDMRANRLVSRPVHSVLTHDYPELRYTVELADDGYLRSPMGLLGPEEIPKTVVTLDGLLRRTPLAPMMRTLLGDLEQHYGVPVDVEFTLSIDTTSDGEPTVDLALLQCRPLSQISIFAPARLPDDLADDDVILSTGFMVPQGRLTGIRHVIFVEPDAYAGLATPEARAAVTAAISQLNSELEPKSFICVGPGRWGSTNPDLGVSVDYSDICNAGALIELSGIGGGAAPDASLGTHFFQDLMEAEIYPLALPLEDPENSFRWEFFYATPNTLDSRIGVDHPVEGSLRLLNVAAFRPGHHIDIVMDSDLNRATAFLAPDRRPKKADYS